MVIGCCAKVQNSCPRPITTRWGEDKIPRQAGGRAQSFAFILRNNKVITIRSSSSYPNAGKLKSGFYRTSNDFPSFEGKVVCRTISNVQSRIVITFMDGNTFCAYVYILCTLFHTLHAHNSTFQNYFLPYGFRTPLLNILNTPTSEVASLFCSWSKLLLQINTFPS